MNVKITSMFFVGAILATETVIKHGEGSPHTHFDFEHPIYNSSMAVNVYKISNYRVQPCATFTEFARLVTNI